MNKQKVGMLDVEPKWVDLIPIFIEKIAEGKNIDLYESELIKIAKIADEIRQAQKEGKKLIYNFTKGRV